MGDAGVHARLHQNVIAQASLDQARREQDRGEQGDAEHDTDERYLEGADLEAEQQRLSPVADVGAGKAPLQQQQRQRDQADHDRQRAFGQPGQLLAARRIEPELLFEQHADGVAAAFGFACEGANGEEQQSCDEGDNAGHDELLGHEATERDVAEQAGHHDNAGGDPQRQLEPARIDSRHRRSFGALQRLELRQQQPSQNTGEAEARNQRLHNADRQREI